MEQTKLDDDIWDFISEPEVVPAKCTHLWSGRGYNIKGAGYISRSYEAKRAAGANKATEAETQKVLQDWEGSR